MLFDVGVGASVDTSSSTGLRVSVVGLAVGTSVGTASTVVDGKRGTSSSKHVPKSKTPATSGMLS